MAPRRVALLLGAVLLAACNPNFGMGGSPDTPPDWKSPPGADGGDDSSGGAPGMEELVTKLQEKIKASSTDVESRKQLGLLWAEMGKYDDAAKILEEAEAIDPKNVEVRVARAKVLLRRKDQGAAKAELEAAAKISPDDEALLREWGDYYIFAEDMAEAVKARKRLLAKHPDIVDAEAVEKQMFYLGRFPKLREEKKLKEFFDLAGSAAQAQEKGQNDEAIEKFNQAIAFIPDDANLWTDLGVSQRRTGKKAEAIASFRKALSFDRNHSKARVELAKALAADGDKKGATATLTEWQKVDARRAKKHDADGMIAKISKGESLDEPETVASAPQHTSQGTAGTIRGTVRIAPALAGKIPPGAKLYVFAKQHEGAGPPLAVKVERTVPAFPWSFQLSNDDVMMQGTELSGSVFITARIDADGSAGSSAGDLEGASSSAIAVGTDGVDIVIDKLRGADGQLTQVGGGSAPAATSAPAPAAGGSTVAGTIDVSPAVRGKLPPSATLFVFAKTNPGGGPPLAVHREPVTSATTFPLSFSLSQNDVMMQGMAFSGSVYITARIDVDGVAGSGPGDLEGVTKSAIPVGTTDVKLIIDTVR